MRRTVLLFDDVESLFMARSASAAKEWHFSQNSVLFHSLDELDTSHTAVVLTTNRFDLLDEAVRARYARCPQYRRRAQIPGFVIAMRPQDYY